MVILNEAGDTLRRMMREVEPGWQSLVWRGDTDGIRWPSRTWKPPRIPWAEARGPGDVHGRDDVGKPRGHHGLTVEHDPGTAFNAAAYGPDEPKCSTPMFKSSVWPT